MADLTFNTAAGVTIARELLLAYLNTGTTAVPVWSPIGKRVSDSSEELDWGQETIQDILGNTYTTLKKPVVTQSFDPWNITSDDAAAVKLWNTGVKDQDASAMGALDMLIVHCYAGTAETAMFAERYDACAVQITGLGGEGGGQMSMPISVTYGGKRTVGTAAINAGVCTFTAA